MIRDTSPATTDASNVEREDFSFEAMNKTEILFDDSVATAPS
jgi:hypothetical protein